MDQPGNLAMPNCSGHDTPSSSVINYSSDISRRWEKVLEDMKEIQVSGVKGTNISAVYANTAAKRSIPLDNPLSLVGFSSINREPSDEEVHRLVDDAILQVLGPRGLSEIIKPGDKVVIKVNIVGPSQGLPGEKGRGIISDPRIVKYVAEMVRKIIGFGGNADLKVVDATFTADKNPSAKDNSHSFYYARLKRTGNATADRGDVCYDHDGNGILDGSSFAQIVNLDSVERSERFLTVVDEPIRGRTEVWLPKFLRTKDQANGEAEYCNVYIGIPVLKSHGLLGATGALKLHWGSMLGTLEKQEHAGYGFGTGDVRLFLDYLCAMNRARGFNLVIMDALTGNRNGPANKVADEDAKTDYILTNAVLCSKDSVAIDTVEALFAGYQLDSIPLLESAFRDGIGMNKPAYIDLYGFDAFYLHKKRLHESYPGSGAGCYPFEDGWGNARTHNDFMPPSNVSVKSLGKGSGYNYMFEYTASDSRPDDLGLARIDFLLNGEVKKRLFENLSGDRITVNMESYAHQKVSYRIAAWDKALNCALSKEKELDVG
ncbi:MAG TPA: DUF362 domain-containing protein [Methanotrichaceae archaeon]|nr:DUF362 domain-containing protein [Methanotrichaceae archaeon]HQF17590.1 DUF362 domain-containing protein [Methanotrichaceae archaeon]HQI92155.1 DUF362 domain-containing protein [Methanotrichaceae archaeon]